jgi:NTP pyrophosphatase (non-canonical NTP hydrolase)
MAQDRPLNGWQNHLNRIYGNVNQDRSEADIWRRMNRVCAGVVRACRDNKEDMIEHFWPRTCAWLFALATKLDFAMEEIMWTYYPGVCPHCRASSNCVCIISRDDRPASRLHEYAEIERLQNSHTRPETIHDWLSLFDSLYSKANNEVGREKIALHLAEESAEVDEDILHYTTTNPQRDRAEVRITLSQEICDVFAWLCAVANTTPKPFMLADALGTMYNAGCPECSERPCICPPDFVHDRKQLRA